MTPHLTAEVLAAYLDGPEGGSLSLRERLDVVEHLADCRECREWLVDVVATMVDTARHLPEKGDGRNG